MTHKRKPRKRPRTYYINQRTEDNKSTETKQYERLPVARAHANKMNREGRLISFTNINGTKMTL
jgi:hypothetical protein